MIKIEIVPWRYSNVEELELRVKVQVCGEEELNYNKIIPTNDFLSVWERVIEEVKVVVKEHVLKTDLAEKLLKGREL